MSNFQDMGEAGDGAGLNACRMSLFDVGDAACDVRRPRVALFIGTRPEVIKMAPVHRALEAAGVASLVIHSGQHEAVTHPLYEFFDMAPTVSLLLNRREPGLSHLTERLLSRISETLRRLAPDAVLVQGDTTSAFVGALAAFYLRLPVGHVEAGLRSGDPEEPFPEEINRQLISRLATWHFAPTVRAAENLLAEGVARHSVQVTGNTVVDAVAWGLGRIGAAQEGRDERERLLLVTAHRRENWGDGLTRLARAVMALLARYPDMRVIWPLHPNPEVQRAVRCVVDAAPAESSSRCSLVEALPYQAMLQLLSRAWLVITDSGGIQEEAVCARVPVLIARRQTERPEVIECGAGRLVGTCEEEILTAVEWLHRHPEDWAAMRAHVNPFGDGCASERIAGRIMQHLSTRNEAARCTA
ncbi:non-hydrolyzing UDP-N-acetylglucosamine 2-epimerase [Acidihalobacter prosperus]|uniref:UDP-N-acetylglucosamine 2-epimerase (non-hydrolyzing) n=1 Tax=Acidihalobacter prosperus TaxID=160660 RepID=A0A1A6C0M2_9GAMM|nr:UDP-N-acetylglucosamine 2-epimerase (non-hydrolyzing) [Acidihalobacter prosperus]OBS08111.1 UDP-N-acetyl glucosamine 2-epimerase [Acidihalobacter prosperus]